MPIAPGLDGFLAQRQFANQEQNAQLGQVQGILGIQNAMAQQAQQQKDMQLRGILGQKLQSGDQEGAKQILMQMKPELFAASLAPKAPKWSVSERFNPQTGRAEKVMVDLNDPTKVIPFGGQKAATMTFGPDGVARDMTAVTPGTVAQDPSKLVTIGPDGKPMVNPIALQARSQIAAAGKPSIINKVDMAQETEENKTIGRELGQQYSDLQKGSMAAGGKIVKLNRMSQLLEGVNTGKLTPAMTEVAALGESLGIKVDPKLGAKQALEALSNEVALSLRSTADGGGMPGAMSDKDREFLKAMTPSLSKTPEGNRTIIETGVKLAKRQQEVAALAREYRAQNRTLEGFPQYMQKWADAHPMFGGGELAVGTVKDGYKYKGGNPADKNSWEKI